MIIQGTSATSLYILLQQNRNSFLERLKNMENIGHRHTIEMKALIFENMIILDYFSIYIYIHTHSIAVLYQRSKIPEIACLYK